MFLVFLVPAACRLPDLAHPAPLDVRNQHPAQLTAIHVAPRKASPVAAGAVELETTLDWTNLWLRPGPGTDTIELDGELVRVRPRLRAGLGGGFDLSVELPLMHASGGVLDPFIEAWHDFFGLSQNQRELFPHGRFAVRAERGPGGAQRAAYELDEGVGLGDLPITLAWFPLGERAGRLEVGIQAGVELPTGEENRGFGNGEVDGMLGAIAAWQARSLCLFAWGGWAWVGTARTARRAGLAYRDHPSVGGGAEVALTAWLSALAQVEWERSVLGLLANDHAASDQMLLWIGGRLRLTESFDLSLAVGEDLLGDVSPDITFHLGTRLRF